MADRKRPKMVNPDCMTTFSSDAAIDPPDAGAEPIMHYQGRQSRHFQPLSPEFERHLIRPSRMRIDPDQCHRRRQIVVSDDLHRNAIVAPVTRSSHSDRRSPSLLIAASPPAALN